MRQQSSEKTTNISILDRSFFFKPSLLVSLLKVIAPDFYELNYPIHAIFGRLYRLQVVGNLTAVDLASKPQHRQPTSSLSQYLLRAPYPYISIYPFSL